MKYFTFTLSLLVLTMTIHAQSAIITNLAETSILASISNTMSGEEDAYRIIESKSSTNIEYVNYDLSEEVFNTMTSVEIAFIQLSTDESVVFQKLPVFSKKLHLNLKHFTSGEYELKIMYANNQEPSIIKIKH